MKTLSILFITLCIASLAIGEVSAAPRQTFSGLNTCQYKITGNTFNGTVYNSDFQNIACDGSVNLSALAVPDGIYYITLRGYDRTQTPVNNVRTSEVLGAYKIDSTAPVCVLQEVIVEGIDNQYYQSSSKTLYYRAHPSASGKLKLTINCKDTTTPGAQCSGESCVSGISRVDFPTILWVAQTPDTYNSPREETTITKTYTWSGNQTQNINLLANPTHNVVRDIAQNMSALLSDGGATRVIVQDNDGNELGRFTTDAFNIVPDSSAPTILGSAINTSSLTGDNGFLYQNGNDGLGNFINLYDTDTSKTKYMVAINTRNIQIAKFQDTDSGLAPMAINIEKFNDKNGTNTYNIVGSSLATKVTVVNQTIQHNFQDVSQNGDYESNGSRKYSWEIVTTHLDSSTSNDMVCDMVWNCVSVNTPDIWVVANDISLANTTHNLGGNYSLGRVSNLSDSYTTTISLRDAYNNEIVPVSGVKQVVLSADFDNTLGSDQISDANRGDAASMTFKKWGNAIVTPPDTSSSTSGTNIFEHAMNVSSDFPSGRMDIVVQSAIPTYNEYTSANGDTLYGSNTALLRLTKLAYKINNTTNSYAWVGENVTPLDFAISNKPNYTFDPVIAFDSIQNIYPLIEGQEKDLTIRNIINDAGNPALLNNYDLEGYFGSNNLFLDFKNIKLETNHVQNGLNDYSILKSRGSSLSGYWELAKTNGINTTVLKFTPQSIGAVSNANTNIAFYSILKYNVGGKEVRLPGIQTGFNSFGPKQPSAFGSTSNYDNNSSIVFAEIDVRGITQTNNDSGDAVTTTDSTTTFQDFSTITLFDLKTNIHQSVDTLLSGIDTNEGVVSGGSVILSSITNFPTNRGKFLQNGEILYLKDTDVTIDCWGTSANCSINGKRTLIIENGNLTLNSNLSYANSDSILGIILIGNTANGDTSKLRINEEITNGVGVVYAEWPVVSIDASGNIYDGVNTQNGDLVHQLFWKWSFATRNTVGGSIKDNGVGVCPYGTPEYEQGSCTQERSQAYDLIYLRRYARVDTSYYPSVIGDPMGDGKIPVNIDIRSIKTAGWDSYAVTTGSKTVGSLTTPDTANPNSPLILEYDSNLQINPPHGFNK